MLSMHQLILLNRELHKSLISGLRAYVSGANEGKLWPLLHLATLLLYLLLFNSN